MYFRPRIIPCLLIDHESMVKTVHFEKPRYLGDIINAVRIFNNKGVDELSILDISASKEKSGPDFSLLADIASEAFMPLSYGGGITSTEEISRLFSIGYEKAILNTSFIRNPEMVREAVRLAGSQSIVVSIDAKADVFGRYSCYAADGTEKVGRTPADLASYAQELGAGEILLNSISHDGEMKGYDIKLVKSVTGAVTIPVIACGGCGSIQDLKQVILEGGAHAAAAGSFFVYYGRNRAVLITAPTEQEFLDAGIYIDD